MNDMQRTLDELRQRWPLRVRIKKSNPHRLPAGKEFPWARRKEGDASPFPIEVRGADYRHYQMAEDEVEVLP